MIAEIKAGAPRGRVLAPPSKSMAHRLLIGAALSAGESTIHHIADSDDIRATMSCLSALGATFRKQGSTVTVRGTDVTQRTGHADLFCNESGSTLRFLIPLALLGGESATFTGSEKLLSRPLGVYEEIAAKQGLTYEKSQGSLAVGGRLSGGDYRVVGNVSSQFISGLLFALPLCKTDSRILITPPVESRSYIDLTVQALSYFGIAVAWEDEHTLLVRGNQTYRAAECTVEGDYSNAAFFSALSLVGGEVTVDGLRADSLQGDRAYINYFDMLTRGTPTIHLGNCPDLGPILMALAAAKNGAVFCGTRRLKLKESDRGAAMAEELSKFGTSVEVHEDSIVVYPMDFHAPSARLSGHNDHRIVMSLATLLTKTGGEIEGAEAVAKSLPEYFEMLSALGVEVSRHEGGMRS
ncbi:MAG: 3-phosphoshikimate 1-carboxyvinyltransferase [Clostridia bacterium]|nr:3-phosphoshikimate 1-carboxyvinyltransferase [Clostridia bacterium]